MLPITNAQKARVQLRHPDHRKLSSFLPDRKHVPTPTKQPTLFPLYPRSTPPFFNSLTNLVAVPARGSETEAVKEDDRQGRIEQKERKALEPVHRGGGNRGPRQEDREARLSDAKERAIHGMVEGVERAGE